MSRKDKRTTNEGVINARRNRVLERQGYVSLLLRILLLLLLGLVYDRRHAVVG